MGNARASVLCILAMLGFSLEDMCVKHLSGAISPGQSILLVGLIGLAIYAAYAGLRREPVQFEHALRPIVLWRNLAEVTTTALFVCAVAFIPISIASAIHQSGPLAMLMGAALFLGAKVGWRRWLAIVVGFVGVLIVVDPAGGVSPFALCGVAAVAALAARDLMTRYVPAEVTSLTLGVFGFVAVSVAGVVLMAVFRTPPVALTAAQWVWAIAGSVAAVAAYALLILATRTGNLYVVSAFRYSRILFAIIIGALFFGEHIGWTTLIGAALIVGSGLYSLWREAYLTRQAALSR